MRATPQPLNSRIILVVSCILAATGAAFGWMTAQDQAEKLLASMRQNSSIVVRNLADSCARSLLVEDFAELETFLVKSADLPDIRRLQLSEPDGKLIWDVERSPDRHMRSRTGIARVTPPPAAVAAMSIDDGALVIWQPIVAGKPLGWIKAEYSLEGIREAQANTWKNILMMTSAWIAGSALLIILVLRPIVGSIARLSAFAKQLDERKGEQIAVDDHARELVELGASLNEASTKLLASERQLLAQSASLHQMNRELRAVSRCNEILIRAEDEATLLGEICRIVCEDAGYRMAWVGYAEHDETKSVRPVAWHGAEDGFLAVADFTWADTELGLGPTGMAIRTGCSFCVEDYATDPTVMPWREEALRHEFRSSVSVPLKDDKGTIFGAFCIYAQELNAFKPEEMHLIEELAGDLAFGIIALRTRAERRQAEDEIRKLNGDLERRVAERTVQLEAAIKELEAFSYSISHDLRAPLRALDGYAHILYEDEAENLSEDGKRALERIRRNANRMGTLIDDVLRFSRIARAELNWEETDMTVLARSVADELCADYPGATVNIADLPHATGDRSMLRQVWANLIGNALKFSAKTTDARVDIGSEMVDGSTVFFVRDNGAGFDMAYAGKLFSVFQRLHPESEFAGTGAGLAIVKRIVERHGGRIWAEAEIGKGATFRFTLSD